MMMSQLNQEVDKKLPLLYRAVHDIIVICVCGWKVNILWNFYIWFLNQTI